MGKNRAPKEIVITGKLSDLPRLIGEVFAAVKSVDRASSCGEKIRHKTPTGAANHAARLNARGTIGRQYEAYQCRHCGGWHVGGKDA